jgi:hypothetical protein
MALTAHTPPTDHIYSLNAVFDGYSARLLDVQNFEIHTGTNLQ